jgi:hypothetical protein
MRTAGLIVIWLLMGAVLAGDGTDTVGHGSGELGADTRAWLELQRSGRSAAPERSLPGPVASRIYDRYLNSFEHPVPDQFERDSVMSSTR